MKDLMVDFIIILEKELITVLLDWVIMFSVLVIEIFYLTIKPYEIQKVQKLLIIKL